MKGILAQTDPNHGRRFWKLSPYDYIQPIENLPRPPPQPSLPNSQTVVELLSSRPVSMAPNPYPFEHLPEVQPETLSPKFGPYTISIDGRYSTDNSCIDLFSDPSASSREDDNFSRTDYEIKISEPSTQRVHTRSIPRDLDAEAAGPRKKHSVKPSVT